MVVHSNRFSKHWYLRVVVCVFVYQADDDQVLGFHQTFLLKCLNTAWVCTNEVFRLALHNL